ncbi:MAG: radical SAM protein [Oscillatoriaceae bacterium SKW80]|nr:radical SAM protein [Oscillatoriaceae bacterium SKYG93]MCX8121939.1 radical SAM protein [Oscillatoriaceae bacterium SKW80]MDW8454225.1 radical SAM protein [Oscillatoriaceae cyanobacterium SKYGB_i_bin93]HIK29090.1 radical SAM protein [Oscillatoriaceae cyanobacterium M7585_C2015_266]
MTTLTFSSVYGPVKSWRYGRSLGIDPIGQVSTCSFNCVYCQLGEIEHQTSERKVFIPTGHIIQDLWRFAPWDVDIITLSGSGEPTLALNLAEILTRVKELTHKPTLVLTNGTLLSEPTVRAALTSADRVSVKLDATTPDLLRRVNRPLQGIELTDIWQGLELFRAEYEGHLSIQTMILSKWDDKARADYIARMKFLAPDEIQLNIPTRPKPLKRQLDGRENHSHGESSYAVQILKCVSAEVLQAFKTEIENATGIPVSCAPAPSN